MKILLFGGSFDPPHLGHVWVAKQALEQLPHIDELWFLPVHNHTFGKEMSSDERRLEMLRVMLEEMDDSQSFKICPIEIDFHMSGQTYQTILKLRKEREYLEKVMSVGANEELDLIFLMGSDQIDRFDEWGHYQDLLKEVQFFVYPRAEYPYKPLYPQMELISSKTQVITNISSSLIKERIVTDLSVRHLLLEQVYWYIKENELYR